MFGKLFNENGMSAEAIEKHVNNGISGSLHCLSLNSITIGMDEITEKNYEEFYLRLSMYESCFGAFRYTANEDKTPVFWSIDEIKEFIGIRFYSDRITKAQFNKRITDRLREEAVRGLNHFKAEVA